jgi:outer membrane immunogenic protein
VARYTFDYKTGKSTMRKLVILAATLACLSSPVSAADLYAKYPVKSPTVTTVFSWTGFYIGANAGYGGNSLDFNEIEIYEGVSYYSNNASVNSSGFFAGGQIGYNYQFSNNVVIGLETDLQWSGINGKYSDSESYLSGSYSYNQSLSASVEYFGTIRARLGYAIDRFLPYITGGVAYGKTKTSFNYSATYEDSSYNWASASSASSVNWGWTIGAGLEYALTNNWTFKAEYLYVDLGSTDYTYSRYPDGYVYDGSVDTKFHTVKAGVNYKF